MTIREVFSYKNARYLRRFAGYLWPYWDKQAVLYICMAFSVFLGLINPYISRLAIDYALLNRDLYIFNILLLVGIISYLLFLPVEFIRTYTGFYLRTKVAFDVRADFYQHLQSLSLRFAESRPVGEHLYRLGSDLEGVVSLILDTVPSTAAFVVRVGLLLSICVWLDWRLTLIILAISPIIFLHTHYFTKKQYAISKSMTERSQDISARLQEALAQVKLIKIFGKEHREVKRYLKDIISVIRLSVRSLKISFIQGQSGRVINAGITGGFGYYFGYQVIQGRMSLGQVTALSLYLLQLLSAIKSIGGLYKEVIIKFIALERVMQTLDAEIEVKPSPQARRRWQSKGYMRVEDVTFGYYERVPVLKKISFQMEPGQTLALIGPSGVGKTTLCYLLMRLYDPWSGTICIDRLDIKDVSIPALRRQVSMVCHEPSLLNRNIRENIGFGNPYAGKKQIIEAARLADAHDFIVNLPDGYDTRLGRAGEPLSQGQQQRIGLARSLVLNPAIVILDEAMSSLNADHEQRILQNLRGFRPELSILIVSHHHNIVENADRVLTLHNGRLNF